MEPSIQYARTSDGVNIAYYTVGEGPALVCLAPSGVSHLAGEWQYGELRTWLERLAENHRLVRLDHRGIGLSDRGVPYALDAAVLDVEAILEKEGISRISLIGQVHSTPTAILFAARHPEMVSRAGPLGAMGTGA